jgi:hypothetical protein
MGIVEDLKPTKKLLVMHLLGEAGFDVSGWANYRGKHATSNPKSYNWSFEQAGEKIALCLWCSSKRSPRGQATCGYCQPATLASEKAFIGRPVAEYVVLIECCMPFSDYIVYVDESGDHSLQSIDPNFPVFSLVFCIFKKSDFVETVVPVV